MLPLISQVVWCCHHLSEQAPACWRTHAAAWAVEPPAPLRLPLLLLLRAPLRPPLHLLPPALLRLLLHLMPPAPLRPPLLLLPQATLRSAAPSAPRAAAASTRHCPESSQHGAATQSRAPPRAAPSALHAAPAAAQGMHGVGAATRRSMPCLQGSVSQCCRCARPAVGVCPPSSPGAHLLQPPPRMAHRHGLVVLPLPNQSPAGMPAWVQVAWVQAVLQDRSQSPQAGLW